MIKLIVAYDKNKLIGDGDKLVWDIKEDLEHFKKTTLNQTILMGETTFTGIGFPLPSRKTIILTRDSDYKYDHDNVKVINDYKIIIDNYKNNNDKDIFICGGAQIYSLFLPFVDEMYISEIKGDYKGDKFFPDWNESEFSLIEEENYNQFIFKHYKKIV